MSSLDPIAKAIDEQRADEVPLREQLLWRIERLAGADLTEPPVTACFSEVLSAFEPSILSLNLIPNQCGIDPADGGSIRFGGVLRAGEDQLIGLIQRRLMVGNGYAIHERLYLLAEARGRGINVVSLQGAFDLYDQIGIDRVILAAALDTGRWHWARVGFEFLLESDREAVRRWVSGALKALQIGDLRVDRYTSTAQFARMGGSRKISLGALAEALPRERRRIEKIALGNNLDLGESIDLGRALMLTGPPWWGVLELNGPGRQAFKAYADRKFPPQTP